MSARVFLAAVAMVCITALAVAWMVVDRDDEPQGTGVDPCLRLESC